MTVLLAEQYRNMAAEKALKMLTEYGISDKLHSDCENLVYNSIIREDDFNIELSKIAFALRLHGFNVQEMCDNSMHRARKYLVVSY